MHAIQNELSVIFYIPHLISETKRRKKLNIFDGIILIKNIQRNSLSYIVYIAANKVIFSIDLWKTFESSHTSLTFVIVPILV